MNLRDGLVHQPYNHSMANFFKTMENTRLVYIFQPVFFKPLYRNQLILRSPAINRRKGKVNTMARSIFNSLIGLHLSPLYYNIKYFDWNSWIFSSFTQNDIISSSNHISQRSKESFWAVNKTSYDEQSYFSTEINLLDLVSAI